MVTKIDNIDIKIGKETISLSLEQAKELLALLSDTFGEQKVIERIIERPYYQRYYPYWSVTYTPPTEPTYVPWVTCNDTTSGTTVAFSLNK